MKNVTKFLKHNLLNPVNQYLNTFIHFSGQNDLDILWDSA